MGDKTKIDWADASWNPVTGCYNGCEYCYARKIANRFGGSIRNTAYDLRAKYGNEEKPELFELEYPYEECGRIIPYPCKFTPTLHRYKLDEPQKWKKPRAIFVCSMADLFGYWVPYGWIEEVFNACLAAPQHRYLFLTKNPGRYIELAKKGLLPGEPNFWYGSTVTDPGMNYFFSDRHNTFLSIEPILERFYTWDKHGNPDDFVKWVIVGAETGNRAGKIIPEKEWIDTIAEDCGIKETPIFMKESLRELMGDDFRQEFPWET